MNLGRIAMGEKIAGVSAAVLFLSMFLDWFTVTIPESLGVDFFIDGMGRSAWDALDYIPTVLAISAGAVPFLVGMRLVAKVPVPTGRVVATLGAVSALLILFRIIDPPNVGAVQGVFGRTAAVETKPAIGSFVGLLAAGGVAFGGYIGDREAVGSPPLAGSSRSGCQGRNH